MALSLEAVVMLNKSQFAGGLTSISALTRNLTGAMAYAFGGVAGEVMTLTRAFGPLGAAIGVMKQAVTVGASFEYEMANVATVTGLVGDELISVSEEARRFAETTAFTANEAAEALYSLGSAGFSSAAALKDMLTPALELAGATQSQAQLTTETLTSTLNAFQMATESAGRVADLFAGAISASPATMERLSEAMSQANPIAAAFNVSLESTVESIAAFHKVGIMGSQAGTAFRQAMTQLSQQMTKADSIIGKALVGWDPALEGLTGAIRRMEVAGISGAVAIQELGIRGGKAVAAQLALGSTAIKELGRRIVATGDASKMYATQMNTVNSQWKVFLSMLQERGLRIWDLIKDSVMATIKAFQESIKWIDGLIEAFGKGRTIGEGFRNVWEKLWPAIQEATAKAIAVLKELLIDGFNWLWPRLIELAKEGIERLVVVFYQIQAIAARIDWGAVGKVLGDALVALLVTVVDLLGAYLNSTFYQNVVGMIGRLMGNVIRKLLNLVLGINEADFSAPLHDKIGNIIMGIERVLRTFLYNLIAGVLGDPQWGDRIVNYVYLWFLKIKLFIQEKSNVISEAIVKLMMGIMELIPAKMAGLFHAIGLNSLAENIKSKSKELVDNMSKGLQGMDTGAKQTQKLIDGVNKQLGELAVQSQESAKSYSKKWPEALSIFEKATKKVSKTTSKGFGEITNSAGELLVSLNDLKRGYGEIIDAQGNLIASTETLDRQGKTAAGTEKTVSLELKPPTKADYQTNVNRVADALEKIVLMKGILWA